MESEKTYASQKLALSKMSNKTDSISDFSACNTNSNDERKVAHNIAIRFKKDEKFSGKIGEDINEFIAFYMETAVDDELSSTKKLKYFHNLFDQEGRRYNRNYVQHNCHKFEEACIKLQDDFSSIARQNVIRKYLQDLSLLFFMEKKSCKAGEALEELREAITKFTPQGPRTHRSEEDKVEYLYNVTIEAEWAQNALTQCYTNNPPWNFQQLYTALDSAWLQHQKLKEKSLRRNEIQISSCPIPSIL